MMKSSGTTKLYHHLVDHPDIYMPQKKEPQFFTANFDKGIEWYKDLFQTHESEQAVGEASNSYTYPEYASVAPRRIKLTAPR
jgi:hypothetical protein